MTAPSLDAKTLADRADRIDAVLRLPFVTPAEGAVVVGVSVSHVRRACASGALAAMKIGRTWRIRPDRLLAWVTPPAAPTVSTPTAVRFGRAS